MSNAELSSFATVPADFVELSELNIVSIDHKLGYFRDEPYVIFGYCAGGEEVIWKDGHSSGFGMGGWKAFLYEIAPAARRLDVDLGSARVAGSHVLVIDRRHGIAYAAPRQSAQQFIARWYGLPSPKRRCLCGLMDCSACPLHSCECHKECADSEYPHPLPSQAIDPVEESSRGSFPCSDAPGYGTAHA